MIGAARLSKAAGPASALCFALAFLALDSCSANGTNTPVAPQTPSQFRHEPTPDRVAGEYIVTLRAEASEALLRDLYGTYGIREITRLGENRFLIKLTHDPGLDVILRKGSESGKVKAAQPNFIYRLQ